MPTVLRRRGLIRGVAGGIVAVAGCRELTSSDGSADSGTARDEEKTPAAEEQSDDLSVSWTGGPDMPRRRTQTTAVALDGRVYVIGGIVGEGDRHTAIYDPGKERWRRAVPPPDPINHTAAVAHDGRIHVIGGYTGNFPGSDPRDVHWVYDPETDEWMEEPPLPTARGALVAVVAGDRIYAVGGASEEGTTGVVEVYDPGEQSWAPAPSLPTAREHLAAGSIDGRVYAAGGRQGLSPMVAATACYDSRRDIWRSRSPMPTARAGIAGAVLAGRLFVFGGEEVGEQVFEEVEAYHPPTDSWTAIAPLPTPRWGLGVAALDGRIYTVGGGAVPSAEETRSLEILTVE